LADAAGILGVVGLADEVSNHAYLAVTGPTFGTRESRHIDCVRQIIEKDVLNGARFDDSIALGAWGPEWHSSETNESEFQLPGGNGSTRFRLER
jgi:hypothetical protein